MHRGNNLFITYCVDFCIYRFKSRNSLLFIYSRFMFLATGVFEGTLVIGLILRSLWGLYKIHETLWFYLVAL